jgi:hypothetical protein
MCDFLEVLTMIEKATAFESTAHLSEPTMGNL